MKKEIPTETIKPQKEEKELTFKEKVDAKIAEVVSAVNKHMPEGIQLVEDEFRQRFRDGNRLSRLLADDTGIMNEVAIEALNEYLENENIGNKDRAIIERIKEDLCKENIK